jgi:hypothetical protein
MMVDRTLSVNQDDSLRVLVKDLIHSFKSEKDDLLVALFSGNC